MCWRSTGGVCIRVRRSGATSSGTRRSSSKHAIRIALRDVVIVNLSSWPAPGGKALRSPNEGVVEDIGSGGVRGPASSAQDSDALVVPAADRRDHAILHEVVVDGKAGGRGPDVNGLSRVAAPVEAHIEDGPIAEVV